jgi:uncharacterized membrane protein YphA (DoxX/SURF4 family)
VTNSGPTPFLTAAYSGVCFGLRDASRVARSNPISPEVIMQRFIAWADSHREIWLDCVRIYLGLGLFARGLLIILNVRTDFFINLIAQSGTEQWLSSGLLLHYVALAHVVGGILLIIGLFTRIAAAVQIPILIGAVIFVHRQEGFLAVGQSLEFSALVLFLLVVVFFSGAGPLSIDAHMADRKAVEPVTEPSV